MPIYNKAAYYLKTVTGTLLLLLLWRWTWVVFSRSAAEYVDYLLYTTGRNFQIDIASYTFIPGAFIALKIVLACSSILASYYVFRVIKNNASLLHRGTEPMFNSLGTSITNIPRHFSSLDTGTKVIFALLLLVQAGVLGYFLFNMPYHYDEMLNYMSFSGKGLIADITYYPVPNNHILYSIAASLSLMSHIDTVIAIRLPNVLISFFTTYIFFRAVLRFANVNIALCATAVMVFSFPFIMYNVQARGYAFLFFFTVLMLYSFIQLVSGTETKKYTRLYAVSAILGAYTMPTFIYVLLPFSTVLFLFCMFNRNKFSVLSFIKAHLAIGLFTFLLYLPLFIVNGWDVFQKAEELGVKPIQPAFTAENVWLHIDYTWSFLVSGMTAPIYVVLLLVVAPVIYAFRKLQLQRYMAMLIGLLLVSPLLIVLLQKSIPFPRTWTHIMIPISISGGIIAGGILSLMNHYKLRLILTASFITIYGFLLIKQVESNYRSAYALDYAVQDYIKLLDEKMPFINSIQRTNDLSFYLAEDLQFEAHQIKRKIPLHVISGADSLTAELIITVPDTTLATPGNYNLVPVDNPFYRVYIRKDL